MKEEDKRDVFLPAELHGRMEERAKLTGFGSVDEYVLFILEEVLREEKRAYSEEDEEEIKKRLRALGYLG